MHKEKLNMLKLEAFIDWGKGSLWLRYARTLASSFSITQVSLSITPFLVNNVLVNNEQGLLPYKISVLVTQYSTIILQFSLLT